MPPPNFPLTIGAGYIGGDWPAESHYPHSGSTGHLEHFNGQVAGAVYSFPGGP